MTKNEYPKGYPRTQPENLMGRVFGYLRVIKWDGRTGKLKRPAWLCKCFYKDCEKLKIVSASSLKRGHTTSCGCLQREMISAINSVDLIGQRFGKLLVMERIGSDKHQHVVWQCICDCGNETQATTNQLNRGASKSCGCGKGMPGGKSLDLIGKKYGRLLVVEEVKTTDPKHRQFRCLCDCGNYTITGRDLLLIGKTKSCGCILKELMAIVGARNYNVSACNYFRDFDSKLNTEGRHAEAGGETRIGDYFVDYINHELKLIIEWDEYQHFLGGKLRKEDADRQQMIQERLPDYRFVRIKQDDYIPTPRELVETVFMQ